MILKSKKEEIEEERKRIKMKGDAENQTQFSTYERVIRYH
jgi:hypothetical protein